MENNTINLNPQKHPQKRSEEGFNNLVGIEELKEKLLQTLAILLDDSTLNNWQQKHHPKQKLFVVERLKSGVPLIILSGEVGCGKTALAHTVASPLAKKIKKEVTVYETPSNIRGGGMVGEISNRISESFKIVAQELEEAQQGILIIDEADDIGTSRAQNQAHHEDRTGLNTLIKELDQIRLNRKKLAVILITNRVEVLDPALLRRAGLHLKFERPKKGQLADVFEHVLKGTNPTAPELKELTTTAANKSHSFSYSDLIQRAAEISLYNAIQNDQAFGAKVLNEVLKDIDPTPLIEKPTIENMNKK